MRRLFYEFHNTQETRPTQQTPSPYPFAPAFPFDPPRPVLPPPRRLRTPPPAGKRGWQLILLLLVLFALLLAFRLLLSPYYESYTGDNTLANSVSEWKTTIARTSVNEAATLPLQPQPTGTPLSAREIYQKNINSIVSVRGIKRSSVSLGSGVICSEEGYIITNAHVISGCREVSVLLQDGTSVSALLAGIDEENDLAVLKIAHSGLVPAEFGNSNDLMVGDVAYAIGNPLGEELRGTMTDGIISAINRYVTVEGQGRILLQTTAALNSGNSGGALINSYGQVVGITSLKMWSESDTIEGLGFAIPSKVFQTIVEDILHTGEASAQAVLGITVGERKTTEDGTAGLLVSAVDAQSDAAQQGLRQGDLLVTVEGTPIASSSDILSARIGLRVGDTLTFTLWREGALYCVEVALIAQSS